MAPKTTTEYCSRGDDQLHLDEVAPVVTEETHGQKRPPTVIVWRNVFWMVYLHAVAVLGIYFSVWADKRTWLWGEHFCLLRRICTFCVLAFSLYIFTGLGITAGAHRLWAHRSYTARLPLRILLCLCNTMAFQV